MKMHVLTLLFVGLLGHATFSYAQDDSVRSFYPLAVGDFWQYRGSGGSAPPLWTVAVIGDTVFSNGKSYRIVEDSRDYVGRYYERVDSSTLNVYRRQANWGLESLHDSLRASVGDTLQNMSDRGSFIFEHESQDSILGMLVTVKHFVLPVIPDIPRYGHAQGFGLCYESSYSEDPVYPLLNSNTTTLQYARINGTEFGTLLAVPNDPTHPQTFQLLQNYPNPFNPATQISYFLPDAEYASLIVYDLLGRSVRTLVQEVQQPGSHTVTWDARDLPSGMYFCRLHAGHSLATIKLLLMR